jgi:hypothetical protein
MEIQRDRLLDDLEDTKNLDDKIKVERFISDMDNRLVQAFSKMILGGMESLSPTVKLEEIKEDNIKEFVKDLILEDENQDSKDVYSEDELKFEFIRRTKCDITHVSNVIKKMKQDGLDLCEQSDIIRSRNSFMSGKDFSRKYNLAIFANLRGYLTINEVSEISRKRLEIRQQIEDQEKERREKFIKKYGPEQQWSEKVKKMYDDFEDDDTSLI